MSNGAAEGKAGFGELRNYFVDIKLNAIKEWYGIPVAAVLNIVIKTKNAVFGMLSKTDCAGRYTKLHSFACNLAKQMAKQIYSWRCGWSLVALPFATYPSVKSKVKDG